MSLIKSKDIEIRNNNKMKGYYFTRTEDDLKEQLLSKRN